MKKRLLAALAALCILSGCGEESAPPYSNATIRVDGQTVCGQVEEWGDAGDGRIRVKMEGVVYFIQPGDVVWAH